MSKQDQPKTTRRREIVRSIESIEAKSKEKRSRLEKIEDKIVYTFGTVQFLILNFVFFAGWIAINSGLVSAIEPFDPYPFIFLTMVVSLEAIILAVFVLITQNRQAKISSLREETELHVNLISEQEITKVLKVLGVILKKLGEDSDPDPELKKMLDPLDPEEIERQLEEQLDGK
jgi:uncharacterized membrane protein